VGQFVVNTGQISCSMALPPAPMPLTTIPMGEPVQIGGQLAGTIQHHLPMGNIPSMGMCSSPANPQGAAATAAALGVLTPQPCIPATAAPWVPGDPTVLINGQPALTSECQCMCTWGGMITVMFPGQVTVSGSA
jgi:hypothetical protein